MKRKMLTLLAVAALALTAYAGPAKADDQKVITGEAACAKCILNETKQCQLTITTEEGGKKTTYHVAQNDVSKHFGDQVCKSRKKVTATGMVKTTGGKQEFVASKLELAKE